MIMVIGMSSADWKGPIGQPVELLKNVQLTAAYSVQGPNSRHDCIYFGRSSTRH